MEFCVVCEKEAVVFGKTTIKVGDKEFTLEAEHCTNCDSVGLSPHNQEQIDKWGNELPTTVAEFQPYFPKKLIAASEHYAKHFGLKWSEFVKVCTAFYLAEMTKEKRFKQIRSDVLCEGEKLFSSSKEKSHVPVRYRLFKQLQLFAEVWNIRETNVLEEALLFCATLLESHRSHEAEKAELQEFVEKHAMAS
jgi:hypothetical protein